MEKKLLIEVIIVTILIAGTTNVSSMKTNDKIFYDSFIDQNEQWSKDNPDSLPIWLTPEEMLRVYEIGKEFQPTAPPPTPIRQPAEFEPMEGVLIRYQFGISYQIIAEMAEDVQVVTIVAGTSQQSYVQSQYQANGVDLSHCSFLIAPTDSYWTRDYGPWFIFNGNDEQGIVDFIYNRPRPNDDQIPTAYGNDQGIPVYGMNLVHAGGNYMTDGQGIAVSTDLVWSENSGMTHAQINQMVNDYCGIDTYHVVPDVNGEYIKHIDCWGKYLAPDTIMIREVPVSHPRYTYIEDAVDYFESQSSCYGTPYNVVRVYTPNNEPYTNSLILNDKVLVPITGSQWDDEAISSYQIALPGYEVLGFTGSWASTDALHCRAMGITDRNMLYIEHTPLSGIQSSPDGYEIIANIFPYSGEDVNTAKVFIRIDGGSWQNVNMEYLGSNQYRFIIPPQTTGTVIDYYIHAEDDSGRSENHPYIGAPMAHSFSCELINEPPEAPVITGPTNGRAGEEYEYTFVSTDPDQNNLYYWIEWDDGSPAVEWIGPYESDEEVTVSHTFENQGEFTIRAKAKDVYGAESDWGYLEVAMPINKKSNLKTLDIIERIFPRFYYLIKNLYQLIV